MDHGVLVVKRSGTAKGPGRWIRWFPDSRLILLLMLGAYFLLLAAVGGESHWADLGVTPVRVTFADLRSVTSGWECTRRGIDVLPANPCDPLGRPANYPRIWMSPAFLGLGEGSTVALGFLVAAAFFIGALAVLPARVNAFEAVVYGLALCSPAVMLGVDRGNVDILVFALVVLAVLLLRRSRGSMIVGHGLLLFAAMLKLFPIFAAVVLLRQRRRRAMIGFGLVLAGFLVYAYSIRGDLRTLVHVIPQGDAYSYGIRIFTGWLAAGADSIVSVPLRVWDVGVAAVVVVVALVTYRGGSRSLPRVFDSGAQRDFDLFVAGSAVYIGSYFLLRNYEYRLVFLLMAVPQLLRWVRVRRPLAIVLLVALLGTLWLDELLVAKVPLLGRAMRSWNDFSTVSPFNQPLPAVVIMQLIVFAGLIGCLAAAVPLRRSPG